MMTKFSDNSLARMDAMTAALSPAHQRDEQILGCLQANLELLYIKAKNYHWNVKGVGFQGVHIIFDQIQEYSSEKSDRVAERMRYYNMTVEATASAYLAKALFNEGDTQRGQEGMLSDMNVSLQSVHNYIIEHLNIISCPVSQNMAQDICEGLDKFNYFVKSSMYSYPTNTE